jgi:CheY-like chemotaxis protein
MNKKPATILFADDDLEDQEHLRDILLEIEPGLQLVTVRNGAEVIAWLDKCEAANLPSLIILDFNMPLLNGLEVLVKMRREEKFTHIPKVIYSTSDTSFHMEMCLQAGAKQYFVKPVDRNDLVAIARQMISIAG